MADLELNDEYAADLYHFASKEEEYSNYFCLLLEAQADYHRKSLKALDGLLPMLRNSSNTSGALKSYLRELPQPLMTFDLYEEWFQAASAKDLSKKVESLREVCAKLPPESYNNFRYLIKFLAKLADYQQVNKMSPSNIAIVLGPNLLWPRDEGKVSMMDMASASSVQVVSVIEPIIQNADSIFPEDLDFSVSGMFGPTCLSSTSSPKKESCSVEPAHTIPPPTEEIAVQKEEYSSSGAKQEFGSEWIFLRGTVWIPGAVATSGHRGREGAIVILKLSAGLDSAKGRVPGVSLARTLFDNIR
ncbi:hypothetical protein scyTo_0014063 [Scyliorhinus torazame]|uniref:Rho-GAP domain-containing protein n=1 Tax=Scyliorhinus torazame TaxID=75743 RepID=A0A401NG16_SCYTO|nr:hypothetical protein [Scyliorhinus torazame]